MSTTLNPYLNFDGNAEAAMKFYAEALGAKLEIMRFGDSPAPIPGADKNRVMHAALTTDTITIMASDTPSHIRYAAGNSVYLSLGFTSEADQQRVWDKLAAGATITAPLAQQFFGRFGTLTDKFGTNWMLIVQSQMPK